MESNGILCQSFDGPYPEGAILHSNKNHEIYILQMSWRQRITVLSL